MGLDTPANGAEMAAKVKQLRLDRAWSQEELAAASGLNVRTIQRVENGGRASLETAKALAAAFDITVAGLSAQKPIQDKEPLMTTQTTTQDTGGCGRTDCHTPEGRKRSFHHHLRVYLVVIAGLAALDLLTSPGHLWFQWPAFFWGMAVALQGVRAYKEPAEMPGGRDN